MAAPGRDRRCRQFRQRGADGDQGQADDLFTQAEGARDRNSAADHQVGTDSDPGQTTQGRCPGDPGFAGNGADLLDLADALGRRLGIVDVAPIGAAHETQEDNQQQNSMSHIQRFAPAQHDEQRRAQNQQRTVAVKPIAAPRHGGNHRRRADDQKHVGDVGADDITCGDSRISGQRRIQRDHQFRRRGSQRHHGHPDQERRQAEQAGQADGSPDHDLGRNHQDDEPAQKFHVHHRLLGPTSPSRCPKASNRSW